MICLNYDTNLGTNDCLNFYIN